MEQLPPKPQDPIPLPRKPQDDHYPGTPDRRDRTRDDRRERLSYSRDSRSPPPRSYHSRDEPYPSSSRDIGRGRYRDSYDRGGSDWRSREDDTYRPIQRSSWRDRDDRYDYYADRDRDHRHNFREGRDNRDERNERSSWDRGDRSPRVRNRDYSRSSNGRRNWDSDSRERHRRSPRREDTPDRRPRSPLRQTRSPSSRTHKSPTPINTRRHLSPGHSDKITRSPKIPSKDSELEKIILNADREIELGHIKTKTQEGSHDNRTSFPARSKDEHGNNASPRSGKRKRSASPKNNSPKNRSPSPRHTNNDGPSWTRPFDSEPEKEVAQKATKEEHVDAEPEHDKLQKSERESISATGVKSEKSPLSSIPLNRQNFPSENTPTGPQRNLPNVITSSHIPKGPRSGVEPRTPSSALTRRDTAKIDKVKSEEELKEERRMEEWKKKEAEIARLKQKRIELLNITSQQMLLVRRAKHESFLATLDCKLLERKRQSAEILLEKAKKDKIGIDYESDDNLEESHIDNTT